MSKYAELREVLKEDIAEIVEITFKNRLESVINAMMPSILTQVAESIRISTYSSSQSRDSLGFHFDYIDPVTYAHHSIPAKHSFTVINPMHYDQLQNKIMMLEGQIVHLTNQLNESKH